MKNRFTPQKTANNFLVPHLKKNKIKSWAQLLFFFLFSFTTLAQTGKVSGKVLTKDKKGVEFATIALLKFKDSTIVKGSLGDENGVFSIEKIPFEKYLLMISQIGFEKFYSPPFVLNENSPQITTFKIDLQEVSNNLNEISVVAKKPFIEQKIDRMVVNVENSLAATGNSALELLEKSPGIQVDRDGKLSLKGKNAVLVLIDDKPTYLSNDDLANYLRNTTASQIETIEIMTNPSAKYDASGNAGIINIKFKKDQNIGTNGSASVGMGVGLYGRARGSLNLNHRSKKMNIFGNYNHARFGNFFELDLTRRFSNSTTAEREAIFDQHTHTYRPNFSHSVQIGTDFLPSKNTTFGFLAKIRLGEERIFSDNWTRVTDFTKNSIRNFLTQDNTTSDNKNGSLNANIKHKIDTLGKEWSMDLDYAHFQNNSLPNYWVRDFNDSRTQVMVGTQVRREGTQEGLTDLWAIKTDYTHPISKTSKIDIGFKSSFVTAEKNQVFYQTLENQAKTLDPLRTNSFLYKENIHALYLNYGTQIKKTAVQLGLRSEWTLGKGEQKQNNESFERNFINLFPTVFVQHTLSDKHQLGFSYGYRIDRPQYDDLNPFLYYLDDYTFEKGNPNLKSQFTHTFEMTHTFMQGVVTTLNYSRTVDFISDNLMQDDVTRSTYVQKSNFGTVTNMGVSLSLPLPVSKKWMMVNYFNVFSTKIEGLANDPNFRLQVGSFMANMTNTFTLPKDWSVELSGFYLTNPVWGIFIGEPMGQVSLGVQKKVLGKKGTIALNFNDMFRFQRFKTNLIYRNQNTTMDNIWDSKVFNVSFSYRFGSTKVQSARERNTALDSELNRAKKGDK